MNISSIQHPEQSSAIGSMRGRTRLTTSSVRTPSTRERFAVASRRAVEPIVSIEDAIARYLADQPPQLYRSGA